MVSNGDLFLCQKMGDGGPDQDNEEECGLCLKRGVGKN